MNEPDELRLKITKMLYPEAELRQCRDIHGFDQIEKVEIETYGIRAADPRIRELIEGTIYLWPCYLSVDGRWVPAPDFVENIADAMELIQEAQAEPNEQSFTLQHTPAINPLWKCYLGMRFATGKTAPIAICRAWLAWKEAQK